MEGVNAQNPRRKHLSDLYVGGSGKLMRVDAANQNTNDL